MRFDPDSALDPVVSDEHKKVYAGMFIMKMLDLPKKDGGIRMEVPLQNELAFIEDVVDMLTLQDFIEIDENQGIYKISDKGYSYIRAIIQEAEDYIREFDDEEVEDMLEELHERNVDTMRVRFLWGLYQGEFDNVEMFQQRRGFTRIDPEWATFITSDAFYNNLALDLEVEEDA